MKLEDEDMTVLGYLMEHINTGLGMHRSCYTPLRYAPKPGQTKVSRDYCKTALERDIIMARQILLNMAKDLEKR